MKRVFTVAAALSLLGLSHGAMADAGIMAGGAEELPPLTLSSMEGMAAEPYRLKSGGFYEIEIQCDGSAELAIEGAGFFRAIWIEEIVIEDLEIRPLGLDSIECDDAGEIEIGFVAIKTGEYVVKVPGSTGETQRATFIIE